jgi:hypothetical protein
VGGGGEGRGGEAVYRGVVVLGGHGCVLADVSGHTTSMLFLPVWCCLPCRGLWRGHHCQRRLFVRLCRQRHGYR